MGFLSFAHFNQAMLAKQACILFANLNSLLSRVLKQRYLRRNTFLEAHQGTMLLKGLRYKIGNGLHVKSGLDPWIPGHNEFKPIGYRGNLSAQVASYILETREWNVAILRDSSAYVDIERIVTIPLSYFHSNNQLIWNYSPTGIYTVKSGFHLAASCSEKDQEANSNNSNGWWKFFLSLQLPPKVKIFAWKVIQHALPVVSALKKRQVIDSSLCSRCKAAWESIGHALFTCKHTKAAWKTTSFSIDFHRAHGMFKGDYLLHLASLMDKTNFESLICIMWSIWYDRNIVLHGGVYRDPSVHNKYALNYISTFRNARQQDGRHTNQQSSVEKSAHNSHLHNLPLQKLPVI